MPHHRRRSLDVHMISADFELLRQTSAAQLGFSLNQIRALSLGIPPAPSFSLEVYCPPAIGPSAVRRRDSPSLLPGPPMERHPT